MKKLFNIKSILILLFILLLFANIYLFSYGIIISDKVSNNESFISKLQLENRQLEKKLYSQNSLSELYNKAIVLGFENKAKAFYFNNPNYAYNSNTVHE